MTCMILLLLLILVLGSILKIYFKILSLHNKEGLFCVDMIDCRSKSMFVELVHFEVVISPFTHPDSVLASLPRANKGKVNSCC